MIGSINVYNFRIRHELDHPRIHLEQFTAQVCGTQERVHVRLTNKPFPSKDCLFHDSPEVFEDADPPTASVAFGDSNSSLHTHASLSKRSLSPLEWNAYLWKGRRLHRLMRLPREDASTDLGYPSESPFQSLAYLAPNGWSFRDDRYRELKYRGLESAAQELGFSLEKPPNVAIHAKQEVR